MQKQKLEAMQYEQTGEGNDEESYEGERDGKKKNDKGDGDKKDKVRLTREGLL